MAFEIIWSRQSLEDLRDIVTYIALDNSPVAESFAYQLMSKVDPLAQFPQLGRAVPEARDENIRELIFRPYRIIYEVMPQKQIVAIARIWHGARGNPEIPDQLSL